MIALFLLALLPRVEIVAANDASVTYRELVPLRVALDPATHLFHYAGCPSIQPRMESVSPAAAMLRGYKQHTCVSLRKDEYALHVEKRAPRDADLWFRTDALKRIWQFYADGTVYSMIYKKPCGEESLK